MNDDEDTNNLLQPLLDSLVYQYENDDVESEQEEDSQNYSINEQFKEYFISQPTSKEISKEVEPLKRKRPLSNYWENFPGASPSAQAEVNIKISDNVIALWKGQNTEKPSIEITIEDSDLNEFGKFISSGISFNHPLIAEPKDKILSDIKKKLLLNEKLVIGNLVANTNKHVQHHKDFLIDFDKNYIRPIQIIQQNIISTVKDFKAFYLPKRPATNTHKCSM